MESNEGTELMIIEVIDDDGIVHIVETYQDEGDNGFFWDVLTWLASFFVREVDPNFDPRTDSYDSKE